MKGISAPDATGSGSSAVVVDEKRLVSRLGVSDATQSLKPSPMAGPRRKTLDPMADTFDPRDPGLRREIMTLIAQYLEEEGYSSSAMVVRDEADIRRGEAKELRAKARRIRDSILGGDWGEVEKVCKEIKQLVPRDARDTSLKALLHAVYKQQYLELIHRQELQKAFAFLKKRLKPLQPLPGSSDSVATREFRDLCFLLTCSQVTEAPSFRDWAGVTTSRERLAARFKRVLSDGEVVSARMAGPVPRGRLVELLQQAVAYQIEFSRYHTRTRAHHLTTLLKDYTCSVVPNARQRTLRGHKAGALSVCFVGDQGSALASGSADDTVRVWDVESGRCTAVLSDLNAKVWSVSSDSVGRVLAGGGADGGVCVWRWGEKGLTDSGDMGDSSNVGESNNVGTSDEFCLVGRFSMHKLDVFCVDLQGSGSHLVSGGYDRKVRLVDIEAGKVVQEFRGHSGLVSSCKLNRYGTVVASGSRDGTVRCWDPVSGCCVSTLRSHLGEITSVALSDSGSYILSASKDNSHRLWDLRMQRTVRRYTGHQNTWKSFVRASFGPHDEMIVSGSEDGCIYTWDRHTGKLLRRLAGAHSGIVYSVEWSPKASILASCSDDATLCTWHYDPAAATSVETKQKSAA